MAQRLSEIDVDEISFVDRPANRKRFAIVKRSETMTVDLKDVKLEDVVKHFGKDAIAKAIGKQDCPEGKVWDPEKGTCVDKPAPTEMSEPTEKNLVTKILQVVGKALGVDPKDEDEDDDEDLAKLPASVRKRLEKAEQDVADLRKAREDETKAAIRKRAETLKNFGYEIDVEKVTEPEVSAMERAHAVWKSNLEKAGVTLAIGESTESEAPATTREAVDEAIKKHLGREPRSRAERGRVLKELVAQTPGLATALVKEEAERRRQSA